MKALKTDFEYKFSSEFAKKNIPNSMIPIVGTEYVKASPWKRIMFLDWGCECVKNYSIVSDKYYNGEITNAELKKNIVQNDVEERVERLFSNVEDDFSINNVLRCHFLVRPMKSGFNECVKCLWNENEEEQRKLLFENGLEEIDLKKSIDLLDYVVQIAKPNVICVTGTALKKIIDYCVRENKGSSIEHIKNKYNNAAIFPLPYSYREIAIVKKDAWCLASDEQKKDAIKELSKKYQDYYFDYDDEKGGILSCLKNELRIAGITEYTVNRNMMDGLVNVLDDVFKIPLIKDFYSNLCESFDLMKEANINKVASQKKRHALKDNRPKK